MATRNPFDLLGEDDEGDPSRLIAAQEKKLAAVKLASSSVTASKAQPAKLPTKPLPPAQAVRETRSNTATGQSFASEGRGGGSGQGRGRTGRGGSFGRSRENTMDDTRGSTDRYGPSSGRGEEGYGGKPVEGGRGFYSRGGRLPYRGGRRGGYQGPEAEGDEERQQRRVFERHSGTGRGNEFKRQGSGRGNWGTHVDDVIADSQNNEAMNATEDRDTTFKKMPEQAVTASKDGIGEAEGGKPQEEEEDKEMTLEEYERIKEEKRKALLAMKSEERKVEADKEFESMKLLSNKKADDDFIKLGYDNERRKENAERAKKFVSINEFLKPAAGEGYYRPGGVRGRGRGRGDHGFQGGRSTGGFSSPSDAAIKFEDPAQFPILGGK